MFTYKTEKEVIEAGERFERAEYWHTLRAIAEDALREYPDDEDQQDEHVFQSVDGNHYVIYTYANLDVLRFTEHDDAYEDFGELPDDKGASGLFAYLAFCAMRADAMDELARLREEQQEGIE